MFTCYLAIRLKAVARVLPFESALHFQLRIAMEGIMEGLNMSQLCPLAKNVPKPRRRKVKEAPPTEAVRVNV